MSRKIDIIEKIIHGKNTHSVGIDDILGKISIFSTLQLSFTVFIISLSLYSHLKILVYHTDFSAVGKRCIVVSVFFHCCLDMLYVS